MSTGDKQGTENGSIVKACYIWKPTNNAKKQYKRTMLMSNRWKLIYQGVIPAPNKRVTTSSSKRRDGKFPRCTEHRMPWPKVRKCYIRPSAHQEAFAIDLFCLRHKEAKRFSFFELAWNLSIMWSSFRINLLACRHRLGSLRHSLQML